MFTIPVGDLLNSYDGDSKMFSFDGEIFDGYYEDIRFTKPLSFALKLLVIDDGIHISFSDFSTEIIYEGKKEKINIPDFERMSKLRIDPLTDSNDIIPINNKNMSIDLSPIIREEIIMAFHNQNL